MTKILEILVTNDDGYQSKGIEVMVDMLRDYGNVTVVVPKNPQSGKSTSITLDRPLMIVAGRNEDASEGRGSLREYVLDGTPVDCAKIGVNLFRHEGRMPDYLFSGINHGSNASAASLYSGTLGATAEGAVYDIPSVGLSIDTHDLNPDFEGVVHYSRIILDKIFKTGFSPEFYLNINFPNISKDQIKGIRMARQGHGRWIKEFDHRTTLRGQHYFWMVGEFSDLEPESNFGDHALMEQGYVTIVPHKIDTTDYEARERLGKLWGFE